jgi:hypothetical protein
MPSILNLTVLLKHLDLQNLSIYEANYQDEAKRKELERMLQYILPLWVAGVGNAREQLQILFPFNQHINQNWWELKNHPELQAKLLASIGLKKQLNHDFQYRGKKTNINRLDTFLRKHYNGIRRHEIEVWCRLNSEKILLSLLDDYGVQNNERESILAEYRKCIE